jgi:hypothetical protein
LVFCVGNIGVDIIFTGDTGREGIDGFGFKAPVAEWLVLGRFGGNLELLETVEAELEIGRPGLREISGVPLA